MTAVVRTTALTKRFGRLTAVDRLDLEVGEGDRYGFLGPNGSGKTTTVRMLLGLVLPTSGEVELLGTRRLSRVLPQVGALVEGPAAYGHLSGRANLALLDAAGSGGSRRSRNARVEQVLAQVGLDGVDRRPVKAYSLGMRQRLGIAGALLRRPRLLVLDEPTNGLDPQGIREMRDLLLALNAQGTTVLLSSHLLAEIEALCTRVGVLDRGRLVVQDDLSAAAGPHRPDRRAHPRRRGRRPAARRPGRAGRGRPPAGARRRPGGPERPAGGRRRTGARPGPRAAHPGGHRARPDQRQQRQAHPGRDMITVELSKMLRRPRTWVMLLLLCLLPTIVAVFLKTSGVAPRPGTGPAFLSLVLSNGALFPAAALAIVLPLFLPVAVSLIAGDAIAGEAQAGTLRYLLVRPVGRTRLLVAKLASVIAFCVLAVAAVSASAYVVGTRLFGSQPAVATLSGPDLSTSQATLRTVLAVLYVGWSMLGVAAIAIFLSTVTDSPLAASLGAIAALITSGALVGLDAASSVQPYLPTRYWLAFVDFFREPVAYRDVVRGTVLQAVYIAVFLGAAWANFMTKDVTS